jgi:hypothetical protein
MAGSEKPVSDLKDVSRVHTVIIGIPEKSALDTRKALDEQGAYGVGAAVLDTDLKNLPQYFASIAVVESPSTEWASSKERVAELYERLRPYGGEARVVAPKDVIAALEKTVKDANLPGAQFEVKDRIGALVRAGALPGSANWTHQYADCSNSVVSKDTLVQAPLGMLWFGGSSNKDVLPRHGHGPSEQVVDGRLFIEGPDMIRAMDVYTGRVLWQASLPQIGKAYDNTSHQPGANEIGSNYVSLPDGIYIAYGEKCLRLNPATGEKMSEFTLPPAEGAGTPVEKPAFGYIGVYEDVLAMALIRDDPRV